MTRSKIFFAHRCRFPLAALLLCAIAPLIGAQGEGGAVLTWSDNSDNEQGFRIERAEGDGEFSFLAEVGANVVTYTDTELPRGEEYRYRVYAYNSFGNSPFTNIAGTYLNAFPEISSIAGVTLEDGESSGSIAFTISDVETDAGDLSVTVSSSNQSVVSDSAIVLAGSGGSRSLVLVPSIGAEGSSTITLSVSDGDSSVETDFVVNVSSFVLPTLDLAIDTVGSGARAGEAFTASSAFSDTSRISSVSYYLDGEIVGSASSSPAFELELSLPAAGTFSLQAVASISGRSETAVDSLSLSVGEAPADAALVAGLRSETLESSSETGLGDYDLVSDTFSVQATGGAIGGVSDELQYYYVRIDGDLDIATRLDSMDGAAAGSLAGLMVRSALYGKSAQASLLVSGAGEVEVLSRSSRGADATQQSAAISNVGDGWLRIRRVGDSISFYHRSSSSQSWTELQTLSLELGDPVFVGLASAGGSAGQSVDAIFASLSLAGTVIPWDANSREPDVPTGLLISSLEDLELP